MSVSHTTALAQGPRDRGKIQASGVREIVRGPAAPTAERLQPEIAAAEAQLVYVEPTGPGFSRRRAGGGFRYLDRFGQLVRDPQTLRRLRSLVIPPAWREVWICESADGHIQAVGRDEKGRRQYVYHPRFRERRDTDKFEHLIAFAETLPALRARIDADMRRPARSRQAVLALVAHLLDTTAIRIGGVAYARTNKSYGLTTLRRRHVQLDGPELRFQFKGKSGRLWRLSVRDRRVARIVRACQELPGQQLFQYLDETGEVRAVKSEDINAYLRAATGQDITAKDFRTWQGTVAAVAALTAPELESGGASRAREKALRLAIAKVAGRLGNTVAVCRKCYIHPAVGKAFLAGALRLDTDAEIEGLEPIEAASLAFLKARQG
jgi:DNA topoisomerase-1